MGRATSSDNLRAVYILMQEHDANSIVGLSTRQISEMTGINYHSVRRVITRPENGFLQSAKNDRNGAATYYHSLEALADNNNAYQGVTPFELDNVEKIEILVGNLVNSLRMIDPLNELIPKAKEPAPVEKTKSSRWEKKTENKEKSTFDWLFNGEEEILKWLSENTKGVAIKKTADGVIEKSGKDLKDWKVWFQYYGELCKAVGQLGSKVSGSDGITYALHIAYAATKMKYYYELEQKNNGN